MTELLTLDLVAKRDTITIKSTKFPQGKKYEIRRPADFGPVRWAIMVRRSEDAQAILAKKRTTKKDEQRATDIIDEFVKLVVIDIDPAVFRELTVEARQSIYFAWLVNLAGAAEGNAQTATAKKPARRSTGS